MGYSSVVTFCPRFFRDQTVNGKTYPTIKDLRTLTRGRKQTEQDLINLLTREHVFAHELFHCEKATKMGFHSEFCIFGLQASTELKLLSVEDVYDEIPTVYVPGTFPRVRSVVSLAEEPNLSQQMLTMSCRKYMEPLIAPCTPGRTRAPPNRINGD